MSYEQSPTVVLHDAKDAGSLLDPLNLGQDLDFIGYVLPPVVRCVSGPCLGSSRRHSLADDGTIPPDTLVQSSWIGSPSWCFILT
jgi:hypothetical protein